MFDWYIDWLKREKRKAVIEVVTNVVKIRSDTVKANLNSAIELKVGLARTKTKLLQEVFSGSFRGQAGKAAGEEVATQSSKLALIELEKIE